MEHLAIRNIRYDLAARDDLSDSLRFRKAFSTFSLARPSGGSNFWSAP
jgi:hypothetical protein